MSKPEQKCAFPNCTKEATFPAPVSPDRLNERIYFCQEHIKEYNKKWNGLSGFTGDEIFTMQQGVYWNRPTWSMGTGSKAYKNTTTEAAQDPFKLFTEKKQATPNLAKGFNNLPGQIKDACYTLGTKTATDVNAIKKAYRALVKQHHPDVQSEANTPERIQKINEAYRKLLLYAKRNTA